MSTITSSNGGSNGYWRPAAGSGSLSSGNHSPLSSNSSSSSLSSNGGGGGGGTTVQVKNYGNGLSPPVANGRGSRYQSPYSSQSQSQSQPSPLPRTINATPSSNYNNSSSKYINNSGSNSSPSRSVGLYTSSYENEQRGGGGMSKSQYHNNSNSSNGSGSGLRKVNHAHASSNEINVTVNNTSSKYYSNHSNGIVSAVGGGNYYGPGTERDKYNSTTSASSGGVSVLVGRSSSYNQINTLGTSRAAPNGNGNGNGTSHGYNNGHYYLNNGQSNHHSNSNSNSGSGVNGLSHHYQDQYHRFNSQQLQSQQQQRQQRMSNGFSQSVSQANTSLNGTVAVAVVGRSQSQLQQSSSQSKQIETSSNSFNGRYGNGGSGLTGNTRQISVGSNEHRPAQRTNSFPHSIGGSGTNGITIGDVSVFSAGKKMVLNGSAVSSSSPKMNRNSNNVAASRKKGILRKDAHKKKMSVTFPKEVCQVIGYGGDTTDDESDDESVPDPLDSASVTELLEKSSTTALERELNRLTTKNTSFNSIKTNLLGYTSIEIGAIVGCTNGTSLTGPSKPLISIGTFETRGQPLKIKKFGSDLNEEREQQQKSIKRQDEVKPAIVKVNGTTLPANNSRMTSTAVTTVTKTSSAPVNQKPASATKPTSRSAPNGAPVPASRQSLLNKDNNANKLNATSNANAPDTGKVQSNSSGQTKATANDNITSKSKSNESMKMTGSNVVVSVNQENTAKLNSITSPETSTQSTVPVSEQPAAAARSNVQEDDDDTYNAEPPPIPLEPSPTKPAISAANQAAASLSNLYILNDGNIASKRSTFLHDILSFETPIRLEEDNNSGAQDSLEPTCVMKSEPKLDGLVRNSPIVPCTEMNDSLHHFDDSLEDSGLDIKSTKLKLHDTKRSLAETTSESDNEKSGSNSDSGTEHDFIERNRNKANILLDSSPAKDNSKDGLFISVEESNTGRTLSSSKASKLSPDSMLSEMSTTESSAESLNHDDDDDDDVPPLEVVPPHSNGLLTSGPAIPPVLKRLAPPPPPPQEAQSQMVAESIYTNTNEEELYDDVTFKTCPDEKKEIAQEYTDEDIEEILYDDCSVLGAPPPPPCPAEKKGSCGSYDFTDTNNKSGLLGPDLHEKIPLKPDDGIEFIGIRKIDAESFLKEHSPPPAPDSSANKKNRVGLGSPKPAKRRVNQFFSTIGKKAGAAFRSAPLDFTSSGSKSPQSPQSPADAAAASFAHFSMFKRSLSQDEVNMTRTQEIYATLSPSMLKNKGLAPVLSKLSKLDFPHSNPKDKDEDKLSRKNKFSNSLKKFLKFGSKESDGKYEFGQSNSEKLPSPSKMESRQDFASLKSGRKSSSSNGLDNCNDGNISSSPRHSSVSHLEEISDNSHGKYYVGPPLQRQNSNGQNPSYGTSGPCPMRPPPPPPRVYSCDQLNGYMPHSYNSNSNSEQSGSGSITSGTGTHGPKPARPPPPVIRTNKVAPSFVSVFANPHASGSSSSHEHYYNNTSYSQNSYSNLEQDQPPQLPPPLNARRPSSNFNAPINSGNDTVRDRNSGGNPPNKPKRKASIYRPGESADQGAYTANYLETTYNHITSLNFETLKLIASQSPAHIKRGVTPIQKFNKVSPLRWSQFYVTDVEPLTHGKGFCFYSAFWEDESCLLLVQESLSCGIPPLEFDCIESMASFEDIIPPQFISWKPSEFVNTSAGIKVFVSVLPSCTVQTLPNYVNSSTISPSRKYFALLQAMDFWGRDDMNDLIVFHQIPSESDSPISDYSCGSLASKSRHSSQQSPNFGLVYVVSTRLRSGSLLSSQSSRGAFESAISKLLFNNNGYHHLLCDNDQSVLYRRIVAPGIGSHEVEAQLRLFLQLKLFGAQGNDLDKIIRYRSDKQVQQWMDKERAFCMKDAIERTLQRNSEPISPLRKSFVEFLMISDSCAKAVLDLIVDLHPDE